MNLNELIATLEAADPVLVLPNGFTNPHSYRGFYDELAFEPIADIRVAEMLNEARYARGEWFEGWKGGEYKMTGLTDCWLAEEGCCGDAIDQPLLRLMIASGRRPA